MKRVEGSAGVSLLECVNPVKNKWRVRWDVQPSEQEGNASYMEEEFSYKPTSEEVKVMVINWYNQEIITRSCQDLPIMAYLYGYHRKTSSIINQPMILPFRLAGQLYR